MLSSSHLGSIALFFAMRILLLLWFFILPFLVNFFGIEMILVSGQCQSYQQSLLLQMKNNLIFDSNVSVSLVQWSQSTDCCTWSGVDCDVAGHVIGLDLSLESISGGIENSTGLFRLQNLQSLNLAFNNFSEAQIPPRLADLTNLTYLNLSNAGFVGQIPIAISRLTRLVTLDLSRNPFEGSDSTVLKLENPNLKVLVQNLTVLRELYLDGVNISANGNEWCQALSSSLPYLRVLSLSSCFLSGPIHFSLANLQLLPDIRLDTNDLSSPVPYFFAEFPNLTSLHLGDCGFYGKISKKLFQVPTLQTLDLSYNYLLQGSLPEFPQNLSLQTLIMRETSFSGTIPDSIGNLKNLSSFDLASCNFTGPIPSSMANLTQLFLLDLSSNKFTGPIPSLHMSKNLNYLDLSHDALTGAISSTKWEQLLNLVHVNLGYNSLSGSIPQSLFALPSLQQLLLDYNQFEGRVPEFLNASSSVLDTLDLSSNRFEGPIPMSVFELKRLELLFFFSNKFNGTVHLDAIRRLGNLKWLDLSYNSLAVNVSGTSDVSFPPRIGILRLASCKLKTIPDLRSQSQLYSLDLSDNQISGEIPNWIWQVGNGSLVRLNLSRNLLVSLQEPYSIPHLDVLDLHANLLQGKIPLLPPGAGFVDYSNNNFSSSIPADIGNVLFIVGFFSLSNNRVTGVIPQSICNATNLRVLDFSNNSLSGSIPTCLTEEIPLLDVLNLRGNNLNGTISDKFRENCWLRTLNMNGNQLEGSIPKSLANCRVLEVLDIGNNHINDAFPCWLKNVSSLRILVLRSNRFHGNLDCLERGISWPVLQIFDLASNNFAGRLPQKGLTTWEAMMVDKAQPELEHLQFELWRFDVFYYQAVTVTFKGLEMELVKIITLFTSIDLSGNHFQGPIPEEIGQLKSLYVLNLSHNALTGSIPSSIGKLRQLESLDLSVNNLNGVIPTQLASLNFLAYLNLSYNHLVGKIPSSTQLQSFSPTSFEGNEGLYGPPLTIDDGTTNSSVLPEQPAADSSNNKFGWKLALAIGAGFGIGFGAAVASPLYIKALDRWYDTVIHKFLLSIRHFKR